jgi:hypothetical protein
MNCLVGILKPESSRNGIRARGAGIVLTLIAA